MENKIYMVSTKTCTKCPFVKQMLSTKDVEVEYIDAEEQPEIPSELGIFQVPTMIDNREGHETVFVGQEKSLQFINTLG